jgi:hypothetical protein
VKNPTVKGFISGHFNKQQVYDFVRDKLIAQERGSVNINYRGCAYRGVDGAKCAVGWLIPDRQYNKDMEGDVDNLFNYYNIDTHSNKSTVDKYEFLTRLQSVHDAIAHLEGKAFVNCIKPRLTRFALKNGLKP